MKRLVLPLMLAACGDTTPTVASQLNLDRPVDMAFACYGGLRLTNGGPSDPSQEIIQSAQPIESCDIRTGPIPSGSTGPTPPGQEDLSGMGGTAVTATPQYFGFILESTPGTVALARWDAKSSQLFTGTDVTVLDADPLSPGKNGITVGDEPIAIAADQLGCYMVTANAGSCDLSVLDVTSALDTTPGARVDRLQVKNAAGAQILAKPAAMVAQTPGGVIGEACPQTASGLVYVAYPGCHLVAAIDTTSGTIVDGIDYSSGTPTWLQGATASLTCPDECGGTGTPVPGVRPVTLDLQKDPITGRHALVVGSDNSRSLTLAELNANDQITSISQIALEDRAGNLGVTSVAMSPQMGMGGSSGFIDDTIGPPFQFVYAVATDRTVRVVDILNLRRECDTQIDPRYLATNKSVSQLSCLPLNDPTLPRRIAARGPGIELLPDNIPTSVQIYRTDTYEGDTRLSGPQRLVGYFGAISSAQGFVYIFNIADDDHADFVDPNDPLGTQIPLCIAHQLRDAVPNRGLLALASDGSGRPSCDDIGPDPDASTGPVGGPRSPTGPAKNVPLGYIAATKTGELPGIRQVLCTGADETRPVSELQFSAPIDVRLQEFPDLKATRGDENFTLTWEGTLSADSTNTAVDGPIVREAQMYGDANDMRIDDQTRPFCAAGVQQWDVVQLRGCDPTNGNADCPVGYVCFVHPESKVENLGACELTNEAERLADACKPFLTSLRRYTVGKSTAGELVLLPRKHELRTTPIDGCTDSNQCQTLANFAVGNPSQANPIDPTVTDSHHWSCELDQLRAPELDALGAPLKRCVQTCPSGADTDCSAGAVCQNGYCMDGVIAPQACINAPQKFELRAGEAFTIIGSKSGYVHPLIADASGNCVVDATASPWQVGRLPLRAPACDPAADPITGRKANGMLDTNPCELTVDQTELQPNYVPGTCTLAATQTQLVTRQTQAIRVHLRGMTLTMVDPTYPGDATCIGDRMGGLGNIPLVAPDFQLAFRLASGFIPLTLQLSQLSLPIKMVRMPRTPSSTNASEAFWVIDSGDFLSTSLSESSTRGKVFRVESDSLGIINLLE
jgi:hypothetical protein